MDGAHRLGGIVRISSFLLVDLVFQPFKATIEPSKFNPSLLERIVHRAKHLFF
jgi:hypothetical protein